MIVQHNIMALNSHRQLGTNNSAVSKNLEKLSSGYRINRAGDDAAGLAISEKMRAQIKGLEVAKRNAQDGVSLVQTAEGALDEVHSMLKRMVELSTQAANGTYDDQSRKELQKEVEALNTEINRIAEGTNFNDIKLLDGSLGRGNLPKVGGFESLAADKVTTIAATSQSHKIDVAANATLTANKPVEATITYTDASGKTQTSKLTLKHENQKLITSKGTEISLQAANTATKEELAEAFARAAQEDAGLSSIFNISFKAGEAIFETKQAGTASQARFVNLTTDGFTGGTVTHKVGTVASDEKISYDLDNFGQGKEFTVNGNKFAFATKAQIDAGKFGNDVTLVEITGNDPIATDVQKMAALIANKTGIDPTLITVDGTKLVLTATPDNGGLELQVGDTGETFNRLTVAVNNMDSKSLGVSDIDISTITGARDAIGRIKDAINTVSSTRSDLGAIQNRLEHTISNLGVTAENMTASESRIRDVDMAAEMMKFTQNNVLSQAAQAMLAQANQQPQQILQLLR